MIGEGLATAGRPSEKQEEETAIPALLPAGSDTIDDLLIKVLSAHNAGKYASAISLYISILDMVTQEHIRAIVRVHRGMVHFADGDYKLHWPTLLSLSD